MYRTLLAIVVLSVASFGGLSLAQDEEHSGKGQVKVTQLS
jgi:hypothetical protein